MMLPQRRHVLAWLAVGVASAATGLRPGRAASATPADPFAGVFSDAAGARRLGRSYLACTPQGMGEARAFAASVLDEARAGGSPAEIVASRIAADFQAGRVEVHEGWVLARAELLACAALTGA